MFKLHSILVELLVSFLGKPNVPQEFGVNYFNRRMFLGLGNTVMVILVALVMTSLVFLLGHYLLSLSIVEELNIVY